jgi:hypothetical protein
MPPPSSLEVRSTRGLPMIIAGILLLVGVSATGLWPPSDTLVGREPRIARRVLAEGRLGEASKAVERWVRSSPDSAEAHDFQARIAGAQNDFARLDQELARAESLGYDEAPLNGLR